MSNSNVFNFAKSEELILDYWDSINAFHKSNLLHKDMPRYTFFDGPPFATGLPHYGHILAGTIKDVITRWAHLLGHNVERRFGWDCHGLPVEYEIDKSLGIKSGADVEQMGIKQYNDHCRNIVMRYSSQWESIVRRLGRWIDFKNDYKTMYPWFMESVWWVFKELNNKGFVYKSYKVMPYSNACHTPLSNFEAGLNYKDVVDPSIMVAIKLVNEDTFLLIWTTTPWTIVSLLLVCAHPTLEYCQLLERKTGKCYILLESRISEVFGKDSRDFEIVDRFQGRQLEGKRFEPPFDYFKQFEERGAFRIVCDEYVTQDAGTGLVQQAPFFGEDDFRIATKYGVISPQHIACPIDDSGVFTDEVPDLAGLYFQDANKKVINMLKAKGFLMSSKTVKHSYPFCWRSDTPLMYRAVSTLFVNVESIIPQLLEANDKTYWVPDSVKQGRFANWLSNARDWAISRNRYWGTPIPMWTSDDGEEVVVVGSIEELYELSGVRLTDLHRENVDLVTIPSKCGKGVLKRVPQVFDCWFESGSMPYAQSHYPFEGDKASFIEGFPADFVAEGIDQTRGWFYTLIVLSTILFGKAPFKNLICNGLILAEDGQKMSKRKKNYPDPLEVISKYGSDALRCYLINSPAVHGENLRFKESHVHELHRTFFIPFFNAFSILKDNYARLNIRLTFDNYEQAVEDIHLENILDRYILSATQTLIKSVHEEMEAYKLYRVMPKFLRHVTILTNVYIRLNRSRLKGTGDDSQIALKVLFCVIMDTTRLFAAFSPFFTEYIFQQLRPLLVGETAESVHHVLTPRPRESLIDTKTEFVVSNMITLLELSRQIRTRVNVPLKYPVELTYVVDKLGGLEQQMKPVMHYINQEINTFAIVFTSDLESLNIKRVVKPDFKQLGPRYRSSLPEISNVLAGLSDEDFDGICERGYLDVGGDIRVMVDEMLVSYEMGTGDMPDYSIAFDKSIGVVIKYSLSDVCKRQGMAREIASRVQKLRKAANLKPWDDISLSIVSNNERMRTVLSQYRTFIHNRIGRQLYYGCLGQSKELISQSYDLTFHGESEKSTVCITITNGVDMANGYSSLFAPVGRESDPSEVYLVQLFYPEYDRLATVGELELQLSCLFSDFESEIVVKYRFEGDLNWAPLTDDLIPQLMSRQSYLMC